MSTTETTVPQMRAESGYGVEDAPPPLRVSGYVCLILGVASIFSLVGPGALILPVLAILFGLFALRRYGEQVPAGLKPARVGLVLALGFGSWGFAMPVMKSYTLGRQAEQFARDYVEVIAREEYEVAMELRKAHFNRFPSTMPLKAFYAEQELKFASQSSGGEPNEASLEAFRMTGINRAIVARGPGAEWRLKQPVRIYTHYGHERAEVILEDPTSSSQTGIYIGLEYRIDKQGDGQWNIEQATFNSEPIVAPLVL